MGYPFSKVALPFLLVSSVLSGCATTSTGSAPLNQRNWPWCSLIGGAVGGGLGATESVGWAAGGAAFGAVIGGLLFGFGIVLAGGCETGWMYRAVEGQVHYWWVGLGNIIGATLLAAWWDDLAPALATSYGKVNLLEVFGPQGGLIVTYGLLAAAMLAIIGWERRFFARKAQLSALSQEAA